MGGHQVRDYMAMIEKSGSLIIRRTELQILVTLVHNPEAELKTDTCLS